MHKWNLTGFALCCHLWELYFLVFDQQIPGLADISLSCCRTRQGAIVVDTLELFFTLKKFRHRVTILCIWQVLSLWTKNIACTWSKAWQKAFAHHPTSWCKLVPSEHEFWTCILSTRIFQAQIWFWPQIWSESCLDMSSFVVFIRTCSCDRALLEQMTLTLQRVSINCKRSWPSL